MILQCLVHVGHRPENAFELEEQPLKACGMKRCMGNSCLLSVFSFFFRSRFYHFTQPTHTNSLLLYWCLQMVPSNLPPSQFVNYRRAHVTAHAYTSLR